MSDLRKFHYSLGELFDMLSIKSLKEIHNPELREQYAKEIQDILHDIQLLLPKSSDITITAPFLRAIGLLFQYNTMIWMNEAAARDGDPENNNLFLTHTLNGIRCRCKDVISKSVNGRIDPKVHALGENEKTQYEPSWQGK